MRKIQNYREEDHPEVDEADILDFLAYSLFQQGNVLLAYKAAKRLLHLRKSKYKQIVSNRKVKSVSF